MVPIAALRRHRSVKTILGQTLEPTWASEPAFFNHMYLIENTTQVYETQMHQCVIACSDTLTWLGLDVKRCNLTFLRNRG